MTCGRPEKRSREGLPERERERDRSREARHSYICGGVGGFQTMGQPEHAISGEPTPTRFFQQSWNLEDANDKLS